MIMFKDFILQRVQNLILLGLLSFIFTSASPRVGRVFSLKKFSCSESYEGFCSNVLEDPQSNNLNEALKSTFGENSYVSCHHMILNDYVNEFCCKTGSEDLECLKPSNY